MKAVITLTSAALALVAPVSAEAAVNGVTRIEVSNASGSWLQVAQVQALGAANFDYALASNGATANATSQFESTGPDGRSGANNAINATIGGNYFGVASDWIYHSATQSSAEILSVMFSGPANLTSFTIYGRTDCCRARDIYNVRLFSGQVVVGSYRDLDTKGSAFVTVDLGPLTGGVPEPSTWALLILGFGIVGGAQRKQKARLAAA